MEHILPIVHHSTFFTLEVYIIIVYFWEIEKDKLMNNCLSMLQVCISFQGECSVAIYFDLKR